MLENERGRNIPFGLNNKRTIDYDMWGPMVMREREEENNMWGPMVRERKGERKEETEEGTEQGVVA